MYFSRTACMSGWSFCIFLADLEAASVKGSETTLRRIVMRTMATPQLPTMSWVRFMSQFMNGAT